MTCLALRLTIEQARDRGALRRGVALAPAAAWLCVIISPGDERRRQRAGEGRGGRLVRRPDEIIALLDDDALAIVLDPGDRRAGLASLGALVDELSAGGEGFVALVARRAPPAHDYRFDGPVTSFACSARVLRAHAAALRCPETLCFRALHGVMAGRPAVERLLVRQIPLRPEPGAPSLDQDTARRRARGGRPASDVAVLLPHRGSPALLAAALRSLAHAARGAHVLVGIDSRGTAAYRSLMARHPAVEFFHSEPAPLGPYAIRHALALRTRAPLLVFHDSDDVSCWDRIAGLWQAMHLTGAALVGSHELRVDEIRGRVTATRFPLDVDAALRVRHHHPLLFPSTLIGRDSYFAVGGLSTDRAFAYDTQFVFRASFALRIANVDEFLYIRRRREGSLTTAPATALGTPVRVELLASWMRDFAAVEAGRMSIERSSLRVMPRGEPYRLVPVAAGRRAVRPASPWVVAHSDRSR